MRRPRCLMALCALLTITASASAQIGSATITGRVTDATGSTVPNVQISITQVGTNFQYTGVTNQDGLYRVPSLQPGPYRVTFKASGFKTLVRDNIDLRTGDTLAVDANLEVGTVSESVEVSASATLLETETSAAGALVECDVLHKLPLYQRYVNLTLNLVPGLTMGGYGYGGDFGAYHIAGQRNSTIGL